MPSSKRHFISKSRLILILALALFCALSAQGQGQDQDQPAIQESVNDRVVRYVMALKPEMETPPGDKIAIIAFFEKHFQGENNGLITEVLFNASNLRMENDERVRAAAARALGRVCNLQNVMYVRRLARVADPTGEPISAVRMAALQSLAFSPSCVAAERVQLSASPRGEPDPSVREFAKKLLMENPRLRQ